MNTFQTSFCEEYKELITLSRAYLLQEYNQGDKATWIESSTDTYTYFKKLALEKPTSQIQPASPSSSSSKAVMPLPPSSPTIHSSKPVIPTPPAQITKDPISPIPQETIPSASSPLSETTHSTNDIVLHPFKPVPPHDLSDIKKIITEKFPQFPIEEEILKPSNQANIIQKSQTDDCSILILSLNESPQQKIFLENISKALRAMQHTPLLIDAFKIEKEQKWSDLLQSSSLKYIIASQSIIQQFPELMKCYRQTQRTKHFLNDKSLYLLSDLSLYLKEPKLKHSLWKDLLSIS